MSDSHPAEAAARAAMAAVTAGDRDAWLACYADDAVLHDPVGGSPLDPAGDGIRGHGGLGRFWEQAVAPQQIRFDVAAVHATGSEAAVIATVTTRFPHGLVTTYDGVFVYRVGADGRITSMRGYWDLQRFLSSLGA
ncbi:nuclear transport factor 2 family protein [Actinoplanes sichuanensis]|uniref:Nuclear transport factor 2 family protein n=1 Tax=Actinoplanes sichuanensis TaxID=512349 RepID=A0ABW4AKE5_9ACTN|nr:nuclear transport factor 2 family protein [Actinoplanes sichuanensis]BEL03864.1 nuclear transport factor 2 family protein [Actinoplanes sichuanensis]